MKANRLTWKQELEKAVRTGDFRRVDVMKHWSKGGYIPRLHRHLRRARRMAEKKLHLLRRFASGEQLYGENGDPDTYCAECCRCGRYVIVGFGVGERENPNIRGPALETECP